MEQPSPARRVVWHVWHPDWLTVYTSHARGFAGHHEASEFFEARYGGRVHPAHRRIVASGEGWEFRLELFLPNQRGAFTDRAEADRYAAELGPAAVVVERFSHEEDDLKSYGERRLRR